MENEILYGLYIHDSILNDDSDCEKLIAIYPSEEEALNNRQKAVDLCIQYNIEDCENKIIIKPYIPKNGNQ